MANLQELENKIQDLSRQLTEQKEFSEREIQQAKRTIQELDRKILNLIEKKNSQLTYPLDIFSKKIIRDNIFDDLFDLNWNKIFYFHTIFEAADGYDSILSGGTVAVDPDGLFLSTGVTINNSATFRRAPNPTLGAVTPFINVLSWNRLQRFRTSFAINSLANITCYLVRGADVGVNHPFFGFKILNGTLYGVSTNTGSGGEATVSLVTLSANTVYVVEARLYPGSRISFYLQNNTTKVMEEKGVLVATLPAPANTNTEAFFEYFISTQAAANKQIAVSYFEYIQER